MNWNLQVFAAANRRGVGAVIFAAAAAVLQSVGESTMWGGGKTLRVLIIGAGAIGGLVGARLAQDGHSVTLVGRPGLAAAVQQQGLVLKDSAGNRTRTDLPVVTALAEALAPPGGFDWALLTVKGYDTAAIAAQLAAAGPPDLPILALQNGVGNEETLAAALGGARVLSGAITTVVSVPAPGVIEVAKAGEVVVAPLSGVEPLIAPTTIADILTHAGLRARVTPDYRALKWTKLLMNELCNASCAILGWTPNQVFADARLAALEITAWRETLAVMRVHGIPAIRLGGYPFPPLVPLIRVAPLPLLRRAMARFVVAGRGSKMPSLYLDLQAGKGHSEVTHLNGAVARAGERAGIATPINRRLWQVLHAIVEGREAWADWRNRPERLWAAQ